MRIGVLSDTRVPTLPSGGHGLGRLAWDLAAGLARRGHAVTLYAGPGSATCRAFETTAHADEGTRAAGLARDAADAWLDLSHQHDLSRLRPDWPAVNWIVDLECRYQPPRAVVGNAWQQRGFPSARIVPLGIDVDAIPFVATPDPALGRFSKTPYLAFCHKIVAHKGYDLARLVGEQAEVAVHYAGENLAGAALANYHGPLADDDALYEFVGLARALLSPCRDDAGGRVNLESAALGTPVLTLDWTGTACHVEHCVSGFVCADVAELVEAVGDIGLIDRAGARAWAAETHGLGQMLAKIEALLMAARDGEDW